MTHRPQRTWGPGRRAVRTLELLAQVGETCADAVHEATLHAGVNAGREHGAAHSSAALFRRDVILVLHDRGYIEPGAERRTWRITGDARALLPRLRAGERCPRRLPAAPGSQTLDDDEVDEADDDRVSRTAKPTPDDNPLLAAAVRCGMQRRALSDADAHPCTSRAGSEQALGHPSRRGNRLYWRDGRVTDLHGSPAP